ncbi:hypothetical protein V866_004816 [Kwoniella sp. B9012]|uniref:Uncharacterized protein n=1 Tax=Kwoniella europaea PYCC6329 TaxID=1423913 RepID=A0AAX4KKN2_9TREE
MITARIVDIAKNIPLPISPTFSAKTLVERKEDKPYVDLVRVLCGILSLELEKRPSRCMNKIEIVISNSYPELYLYIAQLVTDLGGRAFSNTKLLKPLAYGVKRACSTSSGDLREKELSLVSDDNHSDDLLTFF